ncbi:hypothetical protein JI664_19990 [Rhodobacter sp. NTK016B]|uniref:hypothetical protein n=1 Tax=Rhodobacter sp. NTK016B TaxID=2759676 RepID=UPI001A8C6C6E|nr:hypothetical protein [Rhodobacter sp. NTK016B]MBN8294264.1 hypothetical protein [Rhodobacter sp. NTK016B]
MTNPPPGWESLLETGERILWQGRPGTGIIWRDIGQAQSRIGLFVLGIVTMFLGAAPSILPPFSAGWLQAGLSVTIWITTALVWLGALYFAIGRLVLDAWIRRGTWYTLTDRAAFVAIEVFGRRMLRRYGTDDMRGIALEKGARGRPGNVWFAQERFTYTTRSGQGAANRQHTEYQRVGFRRIAEAETVYALMAPHRKAVNG